MVVQQTTGASFWMACTPSLKDLGQLNVNVPLSIECLPVLTEHWMSSCPDSALNVFLSWLSIECLPVQTQHWMSSCPHSALYVFLSSLSIECLPVLTQHWMSSCPHSALNVFLSWLSIECLPLLDWNRGHMTGFGEKDCGHLFGSASWSPEFNRGLSLGKSQTENCCLVSGSYWHTKVSLPVGYVPDPLLPASVKFLKHTKALFHLPLLWPQTAGGAYNRHSTSIHPGDDRAFFNLNERLKLSFI